MNRGKPTLKPWEEVGLESIGAEDDLQQLQQTEAAAIAMAGQQRRRRAAQRCSLLLRSTSWQPRRRQTRRERRQSRLLLGRRAARDRCRRQASQPSSRGYTQPRGIHPAAPMAPARPPCLQGRGRELAAPHSLGRALSDFIRPLQTR